MARLADLIAARGARRRALREELAPLEQEVASAEMQDAAYLEALQRERASVVQQLQRVESLAPGERVETPLTAPHEWPTAATLASELRARIEGIDAEIARVEEQ